MARAAGPRRARLLADGRRPPGDVVRDLGRPAVLDHVLRHLAGAVCHAAGPPGAGRAARSWAGGHACGGGTRLQHADPRRVRRGQPDGAAPSGRRRHRAPRAPQGPGLLRGHPDRPGDHVRVVGADPMLGLPRLPELPAPPSRGRDRGSGGGGDRHSPGAPGSQAERHGRDAAPHGSRDEARRDRRLRGLPPLRPTRPARAPHIGDRLARPRVVGRGDRRPGLRPPGLDALDGPEASGRVARARPGPPPAGHPGEPARGALAGRRADRSARRDVRGRPELGDRRDLPRSSTPGSTGGRATRGSTTAAA